MQSAIERQITNQRGSSTDPHLQFDDTEQHWRAAMESQPDPSQRHVSDEGGIYFSLRVRVCAKQLQPVPSDNLLMLHHETPCCEAMQSASAKTWNVYLAKDCKPHPTHSSH